MGAQPGSGLGQQQTDGSIKLGPYSFCDNIIVTDIAELRILKSHNTDLSAKSWLEIWKYLKIHPLKIKFPDVYMWWGANSGPQGHQAYKTVRKI